MSFGNHVHAVILAGGSGQRFWPESRHLSPKQLCRISDAKLTMLEITLARLDGLIPPERRLIVTHHEQLAATARVAANACPRVLAEPEARNTAAALALAALDIEARTSNDQKPVMISLHADQVITDLEGFRCALDAAIKVAEDNYLTLVGIKPNRPDTAYGYMERGDKLGDFGDRSGFRVSSFREKPSLEVAQSYVAQGRFFWNSGIFVWRTGALLEELRRQVPEITTGLSAVLKTANTGQSAAPNPSQRVLADGFIDIPLAALAYQYSALPKVSIDVGVLEGAQNVAMVEADIGWHDVGSWDALEQSFPTDAHGNLVRGDVITLDCKRVTATSDGPLVACLGLSDTIVVAAKGAVLVCAKDRAQDVKKVVEALRAGDRFEYL
jgi:mannose-1-phosphate guanylyltransferase